MVLMFRKSIACLCLMLLFGCQSLNKRDPRLLIWPLPPDQPRFAYETTLWSPHDLKKKQPRGTLERIMRFQEEEKRNNEYALYKPYDVAVAKGRIYISDTASKVIHVYDLSRRRFFRFGFRFEGKLEKPTGLSVDEQGRVYVADVLNKRIVIFDSHGLFLREIKHKEFLFPIGVASNADGSRIYVVDRGGIDSAHHQVWVFDKQGKLQFQFGGRGHGDGQFNLPVDIAVAKNGEIYVLDAGNFRLQVFDAKGQYLRQWGSVGRGLGQFARPRSLAVGADGNVYVSDAIFGNVQIFNSSGQLLLPIGERYKGDQPGHYPLISGIAVDEKGSLYILDQYFRKLEILRRLSDTDGKSLLEKLNKPK